MAPTTGQQALKAYALCVAKGITRKEAVAAIGGTSPSAVARAAQMHQNGAVPELFTAVENGSMAIAMAADLSRLDPYAQRRAVSKLRTRAPADDRTRLTVAQIRRAMSKFIGFDIVRDEFTTELLEKVPEAELSDFEARLVASRRAMEGLLGDIRRINEQRNMK